MHKIILTAAIFGLSSTIAFAQAPAFADVDTDSSGEVSLAEVQVLWPDFDQEDFIAADTDASGGLNADELAAIDTAMTTEPSAPAATTANPAPTTGAGTVGNPSGSEGTPADDGGEDEASPSGN